MIWGIFTSQLSRCFLFPDLPSRLVRYQEDFATYSLSRENYQISIPKVILIESKIKQERPQGLEMVGLEQGTSNYFSDQLFSCGQFQMIFE